MQVRIGPGLQQSGGNIVASRAGVVRLAAGGKVWLDGRQKRCAVQLLSELRGDPFGLGSAPRQHEMRFACGMGAGYSRIPADTWRGILRARLVRQELRLKAFSATRSWLRCSASPAARQQRAMYSNSGECLAASSVIRWRRQSPVVGTILEKHPAML